MSTRNSPIDWQLPAAPKSVKCTLTHTFTYITSYYYTHWNKEGCHQHINILTHVESFQPIPTINDPVGSNT